MRFTSLRMCPFGAFTDFELTFGKDTGLHLVYGTNGAGKSTTLELSLIHISEPTRPY